MSKIELIQGDCLEKMENQEKNTIECHKWVFISSKSEWCERTRMTRFKLTFYCEKCLEIKSKYEE